MRRRALLAASQMGGGNEITFYIDDQADTIPMKALSNMTWEEFVNSEYANQNSMFTNFRLYNMGVYDAVKFYHEDAMCDMSIYIDNIHTSFVKATDAIKEGKTYGAI